MYSYISFSGKQREHSDWWRRIYDLPHSIDGCWQGLRSVKDGALLWEDAILGLCSKYLMIIITDLENRIYGCSFGSICNIRELLLCRYFRYSAVKVGPKIYINVYISDIYSEILKC